MGNLLPPQDSAWADYRFKMQGSKKVQVAVGPACKECDGLKKAWPLVETWDAFIDAYASRRSFREEVEDARRAYRNKDRVFSLAGTVHASERRGMRVETTTGAYTRTEFLERFKLLPEKVDLKPTQLRGEDNITEDYFLIKDSDGLNPPRRIVMFYERMTDLSYNMMPHQIREPQPADTFNFLIKQNKASDADALRTSAARMKLPSLTEVEKRAEAAMRLRDSGADGVGDMDEDEEEDDDTRVGAMALPEWMQKKGPPAGKKAAKRKAQAGGGSSIKRRAAALDEAATLAPPSRRPLGSGGRSSQADASCCGSVVFDVGSAASSTPRGRSGRSKSGVSASVVSEAMDEKDASNLSIEDLLSGARDKHALNGAKPCAPN